MRTLYVLVAEQLCVKLKSTSTVTAVFSLRFLFWSKPNMFPFQELLLYMNKTMRIYPGVAFPSLLTNVSHEHHHVLRYLVFGQLHDERRSLSQLSSTTIKKCEKSRVCHRSKHQDDVQDRSLSIGAGYSVSNDRKEFFKSTNEYDAYCGKLSCTMQTFILVWYRYSGQVVPTVYIVELDAP